VLDAIKGMDQRMGLCIDIGHTSRTGANFVEWIEKAGPRLLDVHVKDLKDPMVARSQVAVGDGMLAIVPMFKLLKKMKYQGGVMLEYEIEAKNPFPGMQKSSRTCAAFWPASGDSRLRARDFSPLPCRPRPGFRLRAAAAISSELESALI